MLRFASQKLRQQMDQELHFFFFGKPICCGRKQIGSYLGWGGQGAGRLAAKGKRELLGQQHVLWVDWGGGYSCMYLSELIKPNTLLPFVLCKSYLNKVDLKP